MNTFLDKCCGFLAQAVDKTICYDVATNKKRAEDELDNLIKEPENFKRRLPEFEIRYALRSAFSAEKTNRILVVMTFLILILTLFMAFSSR